MKHRHSIRVQIALIFIAVMACTIGLCWLINTFFLEGYYQQKKQIALIDAYVSMNEAVNNGDITSDEFDEELRGICDRYNISVIVLDAESNTIKSSSRNTDTLVRRLYDHTFSPFQNDQEIVITTDNYEMAVTNDIGLGTEYLEMWGVLDAGNLFLIRTPMESIKESAEIANRFLAYVGIVFTLLSAIFIWLLTKKIVKPIEKLTGISEKMINLDFDSKYEKANPKSPGNEVDLLGERMNQLSDALETTISELKTANNELQKDIEKKEEIDEMRKEFLSNVSHELKTPIALIQGYAEGLQMGVNADEESRNFYCDVIMDEAGKMNTMVQKLLQLNQLEFGNDVVTMERFDIVSMVNTFIQSAKLLIEKNNAKVEITQTEPIYVWGDEFKTEEVVRNYFSNALNHLDGDRVVEIKFVLKDNKVRVSVFNTGTPIPEDSLPRIWEKFYKVDKARTREYGGSGVGLSIVKAIMDSMHQSYGALNYTNGVEFWFELETK